MRSIAAVQSECSVTADTGLTAAAVVASRAKFGSNRLSPLPREPIWKKFLEKFDEPIIEILLAAALLKFVVDLFDSARGGSATLGGISLGVVLTVVLIGSVVPPFRRW